jgi:trk system potassium uptake protein TrkA
MNVLIAGGGRTASELARLLVAQKHEVRLVEGRRDVLSRLHKELPTEVVYEGAPAQIDVLERAGIARTHVLVASLPSDADNLALCYVARDRYRVGRTIACVNDPRSVWLFDDRFHVDVALNQAAILSALIEEEMSLGDMMTLLKLRRGRYSLVEERLPAGAPAVGLTVGELPRSVLAAILRRGEMVTLGGVRFRWGRGPGDRRCRSGAGARPALHAAFVASSPLRRNAVIAGTSETKMIPRITAVKFSFTKGMFPKK